MSSKQSDGDTHDMLNSLLLFDSFQLYDYISGLLIYEICQIFNHDSYQAIILYYRLPQHLRRKVIKSSTKVKARIKNYEYYHPYSIYFEPTIILNENSLNPVDITAKIKNSSYMLEFFVRDFIIIQDTYARYQGLIYIREIIKLMHDRNFNLSFIPRVIVTDITKTSSIDHAINEEDDARVVYFTYFTIENYRHIPMCAINLDYIMDDYNLVHHIEDEDGIFFLRKKRKLLNMSFILGSTIISTYVVGAISVLMHFDAFIIIIGEIMAAINDGVLVVTSREDLDYKEAILYSICLTILTQISFLLLCLSSGYSLYTAFIMAFVTGIGNLSSMLTIIFLTHYRYNLPLIICIVDIILVGSMFILSKII